MAEKATIIESIWSDFWSDKSERESVYQERLRAWLGALHDVSAEEIRWAWVEHGKHSSKRPTFGDIRRIAICGRPPVSTGVELVKTLDRLSQEERKEISKRVLTSVFGENYKSKLNRFGGK